MQAVRSVMRSSLARLQARKAGTSAASGQDRRMKYPYTLGAALAQFPMKHHFQNGWVFRYLVGGYLITFLVFWKINKLANSPGNIAAYEEAKRKSAEKQHH